MPGSEYTNEKREYARFDLNLRHAYGALVVNASESGLLVHSIKDLPVGMKLKMTVLSPWGSNWPNLKYLLRLFGKASFGEKMGEVTRLDSNSSASYRKTIRS
jgi:hypothetical protein